MKIKLGKLCMKGSSLILEKAKPAYQPVVRKKTNKKDFTRFSETNGIYTAIPERRIPGDEVTLMCAGDILCEEKLYKAAQYGEDFFFHSIFKYVNEQLRRADLSIANLETMVDPSAPYTGEQYKINGKYHNNAPVEFLDALKYAGFDMFAMSNNHNLDCGVSGIAETLRQVDSYRFIHTGLFTPGDKHYAVIEIKGIKIGVLAYSNWFNRNLDRLTAEGRKHLINEYEPKKVAADIAAARKDGAEFILVYMHWGIQSEYRHTPASQQIELAQEIAELGADYIVGSHPHCLQPYDEITTSGGKVVPVVYSVGNFATSDWQDITRDNIILTLNLKRKNGTIEVKSSYIPCHVFNTFAGMKYPIVPALAQYDGDGKTMGLKKIHDRIVEIMGSKIHSIGYMGDALTME